MKNVKKMSFPVAPASLATAPRADANNGCFYATNVVQNLPLRYDICFFKDITDEKAIYSMEQANKDLRIGVYLPVEGYELYKTLARFRIGMSSLAQRLYIYALNLAIKTRVTELCIPSSILVQISKEQRRWNTDGYGVWVPSADLSEEPDVDLSLVDIKTPPPRVTSDHLTGYIEYNSARSFGGMFSRIPVGIHGNPHLSNVMAMVENINSLGIRLWVAMPLELLQNPDNEPGWVEWRSNNLEKAREVSESQKTPIVALGVINPTHVRNVPADVLLVSPPDAGNNYHWDLLS